MGTGMLYNGFNLSYTPPQADAIVGGSNPVDAVDLDGTEANMPFAFDLRAHYTKFMLQIGVEYGLNVSGGEWIEYYQTPGTGRSQYCYGSLGRRVVWVCKINSVLEIQRGARLKKRFIVQVGFPSIDMLVQPICLGEILLMDTDCEQGFGMGVWICQTPMWWQPTWVFLPRRCV